MICSAHISTLLGAQGAHIHPAGCSRRGTYKTNSFQSHNFRKLFFQIGSFNIRGLHQCKYAENHDC